MSEFSLHDNIQYFIDFNGDLVMAECHANGITDPGDINAIQHAYVSALYARYIGQGVSEFLGDFKERGVHEDQLKDSWGDQWNNEVGRRISYWIIENDLQTADNIIGKLVIDAFMSGKLYDNQRKTALDDATLSTDPDPDWSRPSLNWQNEQYVLEYKDPDISELSLEYDGIISDALLWLKSEDAYSFRVAMGSMSIIYNKLMDVRLSLSMPSFSIPQPEWQYRQYSPLILDMDGDGTAESTNVATSQVQFDMNLDGFAEKTAWVSPDDALLALDRNGNGIIDDSSELFGSGTHDGFVTLAALDTNNDGMISNLDSRFGELTLWKDVNSDGRTDVGEIISLIDSQITSISLSAAIINETNNGNAVTHRSTFTRADGTTGRIDDVWFKSNLAFSRDMALDNWNPSDLIAGMPTLVNYGTVHNFLWSLEQNPDIRTSVVDLIALAKTGDLVQFRQDFKDLLLLWTESTSTLEVMTKLYGTIPQYMEYSATRDEAATLEKDFQHALDTMAGKFLAQVPSLLVEGETTSEALQIFENVSFRYKSDDLFGDHLSSGKAALSMIEDIGMDNVGLALRFLSQNLPESDRATFFSAVVSESENVLTRTEYYLLRSYAVDETINASSSTLGGLRVGTDANETFGGWGTETILPGKGDDVIHSSDGPDVYIYRLGDGRDVYSNRPGINSPTGKDVIILGEGVTSNLISFSVADDEISLILNVGDNGSIRLDGFFNQNINYDVYFNDGTSLDIAAQKAAYMTGTENNDTLIGDSSANALSGYDGNDRLVGHSGNDTLNGDAGNDILLGGEGNDTLNGGIGDDIITGHTWNNTIIYNLGDGNDIHAEHRGYGEHGSTIYKFGPSVTSSEVSISQVTNGQDLLFSFSDGGSILVEGGVTVDKNRLITAEFSDGTVKTYAQILAASQQGGDSNDVMRAIGTAGQMLYGYSGNDHLMGNSSGDVLDGGEGDDLLQGSLGNDILWGGEGDDRLEGGHGDDTYHWNIGDGNDVINNEPREPVGGIYVSSNLSRGNDKIKFGPDVQMDSLSFLRSGENIIIAIGSESILIENGWSSNLRVATYELSDGTVLSHQDVLASFMIGTTGNDVIDGNEGVNNLRGLEGDDLLRGHLGADIYIYNPGDGNDIIDETDNNYNGDILQLGYLRSEVRFVGGDQPYSLKALMADGSVTMLNDGRISTYGVDTIEFSDGTRISRGSAAAEARLATTRDDVLWGDNASSSYYYKGADTIDGLAGNDRIYGGNRNDTLRGGDGNDYLNGDKPGLANNTDWLYGEAGDDILVVDDFDLLDGGPGIDMLDFSEHQNTGVRVDLSGTSQTYNHTKNGAIITKTVYGFEGAYLGSEDDTYVGTTGRDIVHGGAGNDILSAKGGSNDLYGGDGNDLIYIEGISDTIEGGTGADTFAFLSHSPGQEHDITDFESGTDHVDLTAISGWLQSQGGSDLSYIGEDAFGNVVGQVRGGIDGLDLDLDGDGVADIHIGILAPYVAEDLLL